MANNKTGTQNTLEKAEQSRITSSARSHSFLSTASERASVTVLTQALAFFFLSSFLAIFLMGVLLVLESGWRRRPGCSPCFQCFFLEEEGDVAVADDDEEVSAQRITRRDWSEEELNLRGIFLQGRERWRGEGQGKRSRVDCHSVITIASLWNLSSSSSPAERICEWKKIEQQRFCTPDMYRNTTLKSLKNMFQHNAVYAQNKIFPLHHDNSIIDSTLKDFVT